MTDLKSPRLEEVGGSLNRPLIFDDFLGSTFCSHPQKRSPARRIARYMIYSNIDDCFSLPYLPWWMHDIVYICRFAYMKIKTKHNQPNVNISYMDRHGIDSWKKKVISTYKIYKPLFFRRASKPGKGISSFWQTTGVAYCYFEDKLYYQLSNFFQPSFLNTSFVYLEPFHDPCFPLDGWLPLFFEGFSVLPSKIEVINGFENKQTTQIGTVTQH